MDKKIIIGAIAIIAIIAGYFLFFQGPAEPVSDLDSKFAGLEQIWSEKGMVFTETSVLFPESDYSLSKSEFVGIKTNLLNFKNSQSDAELKDLADLQILFVDYLIVGKEFEDLQSKLSVEGEWIPSEHCNDFADLKEMVSLAKQETQLSSEIIPKIEDFYSKYSSVNASLNLSNEKGILVFFTSDELKGMDEMVSEMERSC